LYVTVWNNVIGLCALCGCALAGLLHIANIVMHFHTIVFSVYVFL